MSKTYRIRTEVGVDRQVNIELEQDFDQLEILSLKVRSEDVYTRMCADYGVIVGRVLANGGYGVPNVRVSVFIPITDEDLNDEIIYDLYPYRSLNDVNADGYRYNLLPYVKSYSAHVPTGTFFTRKDVLTNHFSFWLNWDDLVLIKRIKGSKKRPLASNSTDLEIKAIINKRKKVYSKANFKINCNKLTKSEIVKTIIKTYELN